jgi:hypothetical protein
MISKCLRRHDPLPEIRAGEIDWTQGADCAAKYNTTLCLARSELAWELVRAHIDRVTFLPCRVETLKSDFSSN